MVVSVEVVVVMGGDILERRWSCVKYSRNATRYGCIDRMTRHLGR